MTYPTDGGDDPLVQLDELREVVALAMGNVKKFMSALGDEDIDLPKTAKMKSEFGEFLRAYNCLKEFEAELEKRGAFISPASAGILDCEDAKSEILDRLSRIRRARGD